MGEGAGCCECARKGSGKGEIKIKRAEGGTAGEPGLGADGRGPGCSCRGQD